MKYVSYDSEGKIIQTIDTAIVIEASDVCLFDIEGFADINIYYVDVTSEPPIPKVRPTMPVSINNNTIEANGTDVVIVSYVPSGATIECDGTFGIVDETDIEFVTDIPGEHRLHITLWPYQDAEVVINAI